MSPGRSELTCLRHDRESRSHGRVRSPSHRNTNRSLETVRGISRKTCTPKFSADSASTTDSQVFRTLTQWLLSAFAWIQCQDSQTVLLSRREHSCAQHRQLRRAQTASLNHEQGANRPALHWNLKVLPRNPFLSQMSQDDMFFLCVQTSFVAEQPEVSKYIQREPR